MGHIAANLIPFAMFGLLFGWGFYSDRHWKRALKKIEDQLAAHRLDIAEWLPWRETVQDIYDELHFGPDSIFEGQGSVLAQRLVGWIEERHHDFFCEAKDKGDD